MCAALIAKQLPVAFLSVPPHHEGMPTERSSLLALRELIADTDLTLETIPNLPQNLWAAYCLHFAHYNFCRIHKFRIWQNCWREIGITAIL